ncbi:GNAT family N-acetyltransferase [Streptomyces sp. MMS24-I29]|uniref:GNAT family N-acetyltransferase n=1 Tax=Streptomyces sp. MMS24-I29 TaxID=3351480 RepID=UPI003C7EC439
MENNIEVEVSIRPRVGSDIVEAAAALKEVHKSDGYPVEGVDYPAEWLTPAGLLGAWVAEAAGRVVGHVAVAEPNGEEAVALWADLNGVDMGRVGVLARLFVLSEMRGRAVGERLTRAAQAYASSMGLRLVLDVMAKDSAAIRLYERLGWRRIGRIDHEFGNGCTVDALAYVSPESARLPGPEPS